MGRRVRARKSIVSVYHYQYMWVFRVEAPSGTTITQACFPTETSARAAAEPHARFYDELERYQVRGVPERRMKRPIERGVRVCRECGEPHDCYEIRQGRHKRRSWAHPADGHAYNAEDWETVARRLLDEKAAACL